MRSSPERPLARTFVSRKDSGKDFYVVVEATGRGLSCRLLTSNGRTDGEFALRVTPEGHPLSFPFQRMLDFLHMLTLEDIQASFDGYVGLDNLEEI
jgi:hypothetical protein